MTSSWNPEAVSVCDNSSERANNPKPQNEIGYVKWLNAVETRNEWLSWKITPLHVKDLHFFFLASVTKSDYGVLDNAIYTSKIQLAIEPSAHPVG